MTSRSGAGTSSARVGRYLLEDLVAETKAGTQFWRAADPALRRAVAARLIPIADPRVPRVRAAARNAARVHHRPIVQVLDVVETDEYLAVITEWVSGRPWTELVQGAEDGDGAALIAYEVARALQECHALGVPHGRLRPSSIMVTDINEVRVRGLQVDAALYGVAPGDDPYAADIHNLGAVLFAGLTGRWPDEQAHGGTLDGLPVVGKVHGRLPTAEELVAGVPQELSRIAHACLAATDPKSPGPRITSMDQAVVALSDAMLRIPSLRTASERRPRRRVKVAVALGMAAATGLAAAIGLGITSGPSPAPEPTPDSTTSPAPSETPVTNLDPQPVPIAEITDFDPQGQDGRENPDLVAFAIDGDPETAWLTVPYRSSGMDPKDGTGLLLDLGLQRPFRELKLLLVGTGTDVEIRIADDLGQNHTDFELLAGAVGVGPDLTIRTPVPIVTRYVLVWLTNLPYRDGAYQGGIRLVSVLA